MSEQLCPKCKGQGVVSRPSWIPADASTWTSHTVGPYRCNLCDGRMVIDSDEPREHVHGAWCHPAADGCPDRPGM